MFVIISRLIMIILKIIIISMIIMITFIIIIIPMKIMIILIIIIILTRELDKASALSQLILGKARIVAWAARSDVFIRKIFFRYFYSSHWATRSHVYFWNCANFWSGIFIHKLSSFHSSHWAFIIDQIFLFVKLRKFLFILYIIYQSDFYSSCWSDIYVLQLIRSDNVIQYKYNDGPMVWNVYIMLQIIWH